MDDILRIWEDKGDDWSLGEINGRSGYFPGNYVQRIRVTKRLTLKKIPSNKILELQAKCVVSTYSYRGHTERSRAATCRAVRSDHFAYICHRTGLLDSEKPAQAEEDSSLV